MGKSRANRWLYIEILRSMTPVQRFQNVRADAMTRERHRTGIAHRHPQLHDGEVRTLARERLIA
jgi:hypothetical protein